MQTYKSWCSYEKNLPFEGRRCRHRDEPALVMRVPPEEPSHEAIRLTPHLKKISIPINSHRAIHV